MPTSITVIDIETVLDETAVSTCRYDEAARRAPVGGTSVPFAPLSLHRIVCASMLTLIERGQQRLPEAFRLESFVLGERTSEADIIRAVEDQLGRAGGEAQALSFNGRGFDAPVLAARAMALGVFDVPHIVRLASASRFGDRRHYDVAEALSWNGAVPRPSLAHACAPLRIPAKIGTSGHTVAALAAAGDYRAIASYCEQDVVSTWLLAQHVRALQERRPSLSVWQGWLSLARWIEDGGKRRAHLRAFADRELVKAATAGVAAYWEGPAGHEAEMDRLFEDGLAAWPGHRPQKEAL